MLNSAIDALVFLIAHRNRAFTGPTFASIFMRRFEAGLYRERESNVKATPAVLPESYGIRGPSRRLHLVTMA
jgi:hypothetical protein